jgi:hypothetical protein
MDRIAFGAILLLALGLWVHPYVVGRNDVGPDPASAATAIQRSPTHAQARDSNRDDAAAVASPIEQVTFKQVRGTPGFWRLAQTAAGVWWFHSPKGDNQFLNTVTTVMPYQDGRDKNGIHYISRDWSGGLSPDGNLDAWAERTLDRILGMGFKGLGAWSHRVFHKFDIPITRDLNLWAWVAPSDRRLYSPGWLPAIEVAVKTQVAPLRDNANLVGYFIDNELDWGDGGAGPAHYFNFLPPEDPNRVQVVKVIQSVWPTLEDFNRDWKVELKDWKELDSWQTLSQEQWQAYNRLFSAWLSHLAADYFRITCGLIRQHDPNHLILGVRYKGYAPREVVRASKDHTDAQSINYYVSDARLDLEMFQMMNDESGQPLMITEYSFHSLDGRSGNRNTVGFAAQVLDQQARADGYRLFTTRAAQVPYVVGVDWFQWSDEPPMTCRTSRWPTPFGRRARC